MFERDKKMNDEIMLNKLYNMIKTSLSLDNIPNRNELLLNFDKVSKDIDNFNQKKYLEEVNEKFYKTTNLEDERKRLGSLIVCITERIEERTKLLNDYFNVCKQPLQGLSEIDYVNDLEEYKRRSNVICSYLENEDEIANIKKELEFLSNQLEKEREVKRNCEVVNAKLEEKLLANFKNVIAGNKYYTSLSFKDIDDEIAKIEKEIKEKEDKVNAFVLAYESIKNEKITSNVQLEEYSSYVLQMKEIYYDCTKKYTFLQIYKLVMEPKVTTEEIYHKRILIKRLLDDLTEIKLKLKIEEPNLLFDFYMLVKEQDVKVINSVDNMKKIRQIEDKIDYFNEKISRLENEQNNQEIKVILKEYGLITDNIEDKEEIFTFDLNKKIDEESEKIPYENITFDFSKNNNYALDTEIELNKIDTNLENNEIIEEPNVIENNISITQSINYLSNAIKEVKNLPLSMNMGLVSKKTSAVLKKVSSKLGIVFEKKEEQNNMYSKIDNNLNNSNLVKEESKSDISMQNSVVFEVSKNNSFEQNSTLNQLPTNDLHENISKTNDNQVINSSIPRNNNIANIYQNPNLNTNTIDINSNNNSNLNNSNNNVNNNITNQTQNATDHSNENQSVQMPTFDFTTFWDEITETNNSNNSDNGAMPNLPI